MAAEKELCANSFVTFVTAIFFFKFFHRLSYVEAVLLEVQRHASVVPVAVAHRSIKDVEFQGYIIPKDATILINLRSVMMDKNHWGDPENFRPERFLDTNGQTIQDEWFIPFGQGKNCI